MAVNDAVYKAVLAFEIQKGKIDALRKLLKEENAKLKPLKEEVKKQKDLEKERKKILKEAAANIKNAEKSAKSVKKLEEKSKPKKGKKKKKVTPAKAISVTYSCPVARRRAAANGVFSNLPGRHYVDNYANRKLGRVGLPIPSRMRG